MDGAIDAGAIAARGRKQKLLGGVHRPSMVEASGHARTHLAPRRGVPRLARRPPGRPARRPRRPARGARRHELADEGVPAEQVIDELVAAADAGHRRLGRPALLRLRHRRRAAGGARRRLARRARGTRTRSAVRLLAGRRGRRGGRRAAGCSTLLGLPADASVGFVTGAPDGERHRARRRAPRACSRAPAGTSSEQGLIGAPPITVVVGEEAHATIVTRAAAARPRPRRGRAGAGRRPGPRCDAGRARARARRRDGPAIVCAQAGNVNTGAFDPLRADRDRRARSPARGCTSTARSACGPRRARALAHLPRGVERADSWATDAPQVAQRPLRLRARDRRATPRRTRAAMALARRVPRRPTATPRDRLRLDARGRRAARAASRVYAALRSLGRDGVAELVERCCALARALRRRLRAGGVEVLNDVVLNQVLGRRVAERASPRIQADGTCWAGGTVWHGRAALRISVSNWSTTDADVERSARSILSAITSP